MRAFVVRELAHPSKITLSVDAPEPQVGPGQVLIEVYSAGLNFFDILQAQGKHQSKPPLPFILGSEFAGRIAADSPIPKGCPYRPGDRVFGVNRGAYAERIAVGWTDILLLPSDLSFDEGAGLPITWPTSYEALVGRAQMNPGDWVLVTAAAGGVGMAAVQIAKALGARVIAAAGSDAKLEIAKRRGGADFCVNYSNKGWQQEVLKITNGKGVDIVYDPVGLVNDSLKCIAWKGRILVIGFAAGKIEKVPMNLVLLKNVSLVGLHWGAYTPKEPGRIPVVWKGILDIFTTKKVKPVTYNKHYPLEGLSEGLAAIERRETWGKAIVRIKNEDADMKSKL